MPSIDGVPGKITPPGIREPSFAKSGMKTKYERNEPAQMIEAYLRPMM
jgi:hypothetical protein